MFNVSLSCKIPVSSSHRMSCECCGVCNSTLWRVMNQAIPPGCRSLWCYITKTHLAAWEEQEKAIGGCWLQVYCRFTPLRLKLVRFIVSVKCCGATEGGRNGAWCCHGDNGIRVQQLLQLFLLSIKVQIFFLANRLVGHRKVRWGKTLQ